MEVKRKSGRERGSESKRKVVGVEGEVVLKVEIKVEGEVGLREGLF